MIEISPANLEDIPIIASLERDLFPQPWSEKDFEDILGQEAFWFWVAKKENEIVGYFVCQVVGNEAELHNIAVTKKVQRQGVGKFLLEKLIAALQEKNVEELFLMVRASNTSAKNLYGYFGFEKIGTRKKYYHLPDEDAFIYRFNLPLPQ